MSSKNSTLQKEDRALAKLKFDPASHSRFITVCPLERPGVIEFGAWENTVWLSIWMKPYNQKSEIAHLIFLDCPTARQITYRLLFLEGQAQLPIDAEEDWSILGVNAWSTRRSFGTLWISKNCFAKSLEPKRGRLVATTIETKPIVEPVLQAPEELTAQTP
jgi:hypothetical protein